VRGLISKGGLFVSFITPDGENDSQWKRLFGLDQLSTLEVTLGVVMAVALVVSTGSSWNVFLGVYYFLMRIFTILTAIS
jgi:hypothetical protein